ncbi:MAG: DUF2802 domain-containing protein [Kangiellaceae bacterium]
METWLFQHIISANQIIVIQSLIIIMSIVVLAKTSRVQKQQAKQISQIKNEIKAINSGNVGIGRKINSVSKEIASVELDKITQLQPGNQEKTYQQASILLKRGASIEEVVDSCDVAPAEAELLAIMSLASDNSGAQKSDNLQNRDSASQRENLSIAS